MKRFMMVVLLGVVALAVAQAPQLVGTWQGKMSVVPKPGATADDRKMDIMMGSILRQIKIELQIKRDGTFVMEALKPSDSKAERIEGKWTVSGRVLTLQTLTESGKDRTKKDPTQFTISTDGKSLVQKVKPGKDPVKVEYTRKPLGS